MKIIIISGIFPPDAGGPATYVPSIAKALTDNGHFITIITLSNSLLHDDTIYPFRVLRISRSKAKWLRLLQSVYIISKNAYHSDLILSNGLFIESIISSWLTGKPMVIKVVEDWALQLCTGLGLVTDNQDDFQLKRYNWQVETIKLLRNLVFKQANKIITPSHYLSSIIKNWGINPSKIKVIYNACDTTTHQDYRPKLPQFDGFTIVTVGRLIPLKSIDQLIDILVHLPNTRLLIVGDGPQRAELEEQASKHSLSDRTIFVGHIPQNHVQNYLRLADIFILNSTYEGLPHSILEAMQANIPVIATRVGGTREIIEDHKNGLLVKSGDKIELINAIKKLLHDPLLRQNLAEQAKKDIMEKFNWQKLYKETEDALKAMITNH